MDTSEQFIKMCDCPEIQEGHEYAYGDWGLIKQNDGEIKSHVATFGEYSEPIYGMMSDSGCGCCSGSAETSVWLPRQDQLQELVDYGSRREEEERFHIWFLTQYYDRQGPSLVTWGQLWLAFVMKEKYGKTWDGETWSEPSVMPNGVERHICDKCSKPVEFGIHCDCDEVKHV